MVTHIKGRSHLCGAITTYLGLSTPRISHKTHVNGSTSHIEPDEGGITQKGGTKGKRFRKGLKGITCKAKLQIRDASIILERMFGKENLSFLTVTIPTMPLADHIKIIANWSEVVRRYMERLRKLILERCGSDLFLCVTELQEERGDRENNIYPHLHIVFPGRGNRWSKWIISKDEARELWAKSLKSILKYTPDCKAATRIEKIKYSLEHYLAKYMSKGSKTLESVKAQGLEEYIPKSWLYMSDDLRKAANDSVQQLDPKVAEFIFDNHEFLKEIGVLAWSFQLELEYEDRQTNFMIKRKAAVMAGFDRSKPQEKHIKLIESMIRYK